jgi:hypothetical protein
MPLPTVGDDDALVRVLAWYPLAQLPRRSVGLDEAEDLVATMAGLRDAIPPVHGVLTP